MAMVTAMVMAMGDERVDQRSRRLLRPLPNFPVRRLAALSFAPPAVRICVAGLGCLALAVPAHAENWRVTSSASISEQYTSNVNYSAAGTPEGDFGTTVTGSLSISGQGARVKLNGSV